MKKLVRILITLAMVFSFVSPALAAEDGPVTGSFTLQVPPSITAINIYTNTGLSTVATSLQPGSTYYVKLDVTDNDGLSDLRNVDLVLNRTSPSSPPTSDIEYLATTGKDGDVQTWDVVNWAPSVEGEPTITHGLAGTTWTLTTQKSPAESALVVGTTSAEFVFAVKIGKVAAETEDISTYKWQISARAVDSGGYKSYASYNASGSYGLPMNWYGEISMPTAGLDWGTVKTGVAFADADKTPLITTEGVDLGKDASIIYISNGNYKDGVKAAATTWTTGTNTVTLKDTHANATNTFSLRVNQTTSSETPASETKVSETLSTNFITDIGTITAETGATGILYHVYLSLSNNITYPGKYSGTINFVIANSSRSN